MWHANFSFFLSHTNKYLYHLVTKTLSLKISELSSALTIEGPLLCNVKYWPEAGPSEFQAAFGVLRLSDI